MDRVPTVTQTPASDAVKDPLFTLMVAKARTMPTQELAAEHAKGVELDWRATWYATTMHVLEHVLAERGVKVASSEVVR